MKVYVIERIEPHIVVDATTDYATAMNQKFTQPHTLTEWENGVITREWISEKNKWVVNGRHSYSEH